MALTEQEELELLELEEEEYQANLNKDKQEVQPRPIAAAASALSNAFSIGDELKAGVESLLPNPTKEIDEKLLAEGFTGDLQPKPYSDLLSEYQAKREQLKTENPVAYGIGATARELALAPLAVPAKALGALGTAAKVAAPVVSSAIQGGLEGFGESEATLAQDPLQVAKDTGTGLLTGGAFGTGGELLQTGLQKAAPMLQERAQESAAKALGYSKKQIKKILKEKGEKGLEEVRALGQKAMDEKIVTPFSKPETRFEKIQEIIDSKEESLTSALQRMQDLFASEPKNLERFGKSIDDIKESALTNFLENNPNAKKADIDSFKKALDTLSDYGDEYMGKLKLSPSDLQAEKIALNQSGKFDSETNPNAVVEAARSLRTEYKKAIEDYAKLAGTIKDEAPEQISKINQDLGKLYEMRKAAEDSVASGLSRGGKSEKVGSLLQGVAITQMNPALLAALGYSDIMDKYGAGIGASLKSGASKLSQKMTEPIGAGLSSFAQSTSREAGKLATDKLTDNSSQDIVQKSPEDFSMMAEKAMQGGTPEDLELAELLNITSQQTGVQKTASIFKMMQNPKYRERLKKLSRGE